MAQGVNRVVKFMLFVFNFIFFASGVAIIIGCSLVFADFSYYEAYMGPNGLALIVFIVFLCVGVFIFLTGFFGCCGAMRENYCMLFTYAFIILGLLLVEIGAGIGAFILRDKISSKIDKKMLIELDNYPNATNASQELFDGMQQQLECCGVKDYKDWFGVYANATANAVPASCCRSKDTCDHFDIPTDPAEAGKTIYTRGCSESLKKFLKNNLMTIIIICICIGLIEITGIFCSCGLMRSIKNDYEVV